MGSLAYDQPLPGFYKDTRKAYPQTNLFLVVKPSRTWNPPDGFRVVHWVRDPVDMIASAYRYLSEGREPWMLRPMHCNYCDERALRVLAEACAGSHRKHCTFHNLAQSVNETEGALYVATLLQRQLQDMADNLFRWQGSESTVLHLSVQALREDFDGAATCMLRFAGVSAARRLALLPEIQKLDLHRRTSGAGAEHATSGRYANAGIKDFLRSQPVWGAQFAELVSAMRKVSWRQNQTYGCPAIIS